MMLEKRKEKKRGEKVMARKEEVEEARKGQKDRKDGEEKEGEKRRRDQKKQGVRRNRDDNDDIGERIPRDREEKKQRRRKLKIEGGEEETAEEYERGLKKSEKEERECERIKD